MSFSLSRITVCAGLLAVAGGCVTAPITHEASVVAPIDRAGVAPDTYALHQSLFVLDTHLDTPASFVTPRGFDVMERHAFERDGSQVDLPRMRDGGLDGGFWVIYTPQGKLTPDAYSKVRDTAILRSVAIREMAARDNADFGLATTVADAKRLRDEGKLVVFQSIENSYPLGEDLGLMQTFYDLGVRLIGPVHSSNNQFADSSTDAAGPVWNGLSPAGRELVKEANRLGMVLDGSHASDEVLDQMIDLSATPVLLSHSGVKDLHDHPRNIPDALLLKLASSGGVIQMNALGRYIADIPPNSKERTDALTALRTKWGNVNALSDQDYRAYLDEMEALNQQFPQSMADFEDYMKQFLHALKLVGPDHVGMGADWDGGGGVAGLEDVSQLPKVTERLLAEGYTAEDLQKIWSGNVLRLVQAAADYAEAQKAK